MIKKLFRFLFISFIIFFITLFFYREKQKKIQKYIKQVETISTNVEQNELSWINIDVEKSVVSTWLNKTWFVDEKEQKKMIEKIIADQLVVIDSISLLSSNEKWTEKRYQKLYLQEMKKNNIYLAIKAIKRILKTTDHKEIWYSKIIDLYIKIWDFKSAEEYSKKLLKIQANKENLNRYLYIKFQNINLFDDKQVKDIKDLITTLYKKRVINGEELSFYNFLVELLTKWDVKNIGSLLDTLIKTTNSEHKTFLLSIKKDLEIYKSKKWSPLYYFKSLVALDLLKFWYFGLAKNIAEQVYIQDDSYVLPMQILAYSYFFMWNYEKAIEYFQKLKDNYKDDSVKDYNFFIWISYYWLKKYENAILFLSQVEKTNPYYLDVLRYKILSYMELEDKSNILESIASLSNFKLNYVDYYNIFKYLLIKCPDCSKNNIKLIIKLIRKCYQDTEKDKQYVCWYGKANFYNNLGKKYYAIRYFKLLTKYFQDPYIYENLANYYYKKWDKIKARNYYLKELLYTSKDKKREEIKNKIKELFFSK